MEEFLTSLLVPIPLHAFGVAFLAYKAYTARDMPSRQFAARLAFCTLILTVPSITSYQESLRLDVPWWQYTLGGIATHAVVILSYFLSDQLINGNAYSSGDIIKHKVFLISAPITVLMVAVEIMRRDHYVSHSNPLEFEWTWEYGASNLFGCGVIIAVDALLTRMYFIKIFQKMSLSYKIRWTCLFVATFLSLACAFGTLTNMLMTFFISNPYQMQVSRFIQNIIRPSVYIFLFLGIIIPHSFYTFILHPVISITERRLQKQRQLLGYLHQKMVQIVPRLHLQDDQIDEVSLLIEISDIRRTILSHSCNTSPITCQEEAMLLNSLLRSKVVLDQPGQHKPVTVYRDVIRHNISVAKYLEQLERQDFGYFTRKA